MLHLTVYRLKKEPLKIKTDQLESADDLKKRLLKKPPYGMTISDRIGGHLLNKEDIDHIVVQTFNEEGQLMAEEIVKTKQEAKEEPKEANSEPQRPESYSAEVEVVAPSNKSLVVGSAFRNKFESFLTKVNKSSQRQDDFLNEIVTKEQRKEELLKTISANQEQEISSLEDVAKRKWSE